MQEIPDEPTVTVRCRLFITSKKYKKKTGSTTTVEPAKKERRDEELPLI